MQVFLNSMFVNLYMDPVSISQAEARGGVLLAYDRFSMYFWMFLVPLLLLKHRLKNFQSSVFLYKDRIRVHFPNRNLYKDIFAQDVVGCLQQMRSITIAIIESVSCVEFLDPGRGNFSNQNTCGCRHHNISKL